MRITAPAPTRIPVAVPLPWSGSPQLVRWWQMCQSAVGPALPLLPELDQLLAAHVIAFVGGGSRHTRVEPDLLRVVGYAATVGYRLCAVSFPMAPGVPGGCWLPERHEGECVPAQNAWALWRRTFRRRPIVAGSVVCERCTAGRWAAAPAGCAHQSWSRR